MRPILAEDGSGLLWSSQINWWVSWVAACNARFWVFAVTYKQRSSITELKSLVESGVPVIVEWFSPEDNGHYSPVVGFEGDDILLADSLIGDIRRMPIKQFEIRWFEIDDYPPKEPANFFLREIFIIKPKTF